MLDWPKLYFKKRKGGGCLEKLCDDDDGVK